MRATALGLALGCGVAGGWWWAMRPVPSVVLPQKIEQMKIGVLTRFLSISSHPSCKEAQAALPNLAPATLQSLIDWAPRPPAEMMDVLLSAKEPLLADPKLTRAFLNATLQRKDKLPTSQAFTHLVAPAEISLPESDRLEALRQLADRAIQEHDNQLAAEILLRACDSPVADWPVLDLFVAVCRSSRRPGSAVQVIRDWLIEPPDGTRPQDLDIARDLLVRVQIESDHAREALDECLKQLAAGGASPVPERLLRRALTPARLCGKTEALLPWIERFLAQLDCDRLEWSELGPDADPKWKEWAAQAAAFAEKAHFEPRACDLYLRMAAAAVPGAMARAWMLSPKLGRKDECLALLDRIATTNEGCAELLTAALDVSALREPKLARELLQTLEQRHPQCQELQLQRAKFLTAGKDARSCLSTWQSFVGRFPTDTEGVRELALCQLAAGFPDSAFQTLKRLSVAEVDATSLRMLASLAIASGQMHIARQALDELAARDTPAEPGDALLRVRSGAGALAKVSER
ncbi:MAG: hypothetical protein KDK97_08135 [Verrucomicrobiales bacterium]|nr:hypothetical protein [Verrucomicrobiales bacterium]